MANGASRTCAAHQPHFNQTSCQLGCSLKMNRFPFRTWHAARYSRFLDREHKLEELALERRRFPIHDERTRYVAYVAIYFGAGIENICTALAQLARRENVQLVYPVHSNPHVMGTVTARLGGLNNVFLLPPLDYVSFVDLMLRAYFVISDSGGVQEEAPSLGKPILIMRD